MFKTAVVLFCDTPWSKQVISTGLAFFSEEVSEHLSRCHPSSAQVAGQAFRTATGRKTNECGIWKAGIIHRGLDSAETLGCLQGSGKWSLEGSRILESGGCWGAW